ncbi:MAG: NAD(P)/FAD-dependent oxidoreductase [Caldilineaceae bacterium]|nr:NAD(P)/FAD-dependent oxidoreductase [Caldilineaceae bacterium]
MNNGKTASPNSQRVQTERSLAARRIAIIGGGLTGLTAAYDLMNRQPNGMPPPHVTIYEASAQLGGLAAGFRGRPEWDWPLEHFYHHLFTNDEAILGLTKELGLSHLLQIHSPVTTMYVQGKNYPFDSPLRLLQFPHLSLYHKLRMGLVIAYLRYHPNPPWQTFDKLLADEWLERWMGRTAYDMLWRPMLQGKFGKHYADVNLAWFWARIYKRTPKLGYYQGGFQAFVDGLARKVRELGAALHTSVPVTEIHALPGGGFRIDSTDLPNAEYDMVLSTVSPNLMQRLTPDLPTSYLEQLSKLKSMGAVVLTIAIKQQLMQEIYWVNVPKPAGLPFLALVEHTNMIDPKHYAGDHLLYIGNYLDSDHPHFKMSAQELLAEFIPHLAHFNPQFQADWVTGTWVHKAAYAQPVPPVGYADMIPDVRTPLPGLYFASMSQVYPWDRGTNYAVEMGRKVAKMIYADQKKLGVPTAGQKSSIIS